MHGSGLEKHFFVYVPHRPYCTPSVRLFPKIGLSPTLIELHYESVDRTYPIRG